VVALGGAWSRATGRSDEELLGDGWLSSVHPEDEPRVTGIRRTSREAGTAYSLDLRLRGRDGAYRWWFERGEPCDDATTGCFVGSLLDVHERRQHEEDLAERTRSMRLAERRQGEFLARLSHELRNPLAPIGNAANVLRTLEHTNPILVRLREVLERQVARLGRMVEGLIDVTRIAHGQVSLVREATTAERIVQAAAARAGEAILAGGHRLQVLPGDGPHPIDGDIERLTQALASLLDNAARHSPQASTIVVEAHRVARTVQIAVRDSGRGIDPSFLPHAFELFSTEDRSDGPPSRGLGLGLPFARRIAQLHGGDVEGSSDGRGRGSEFVLWLPLADGKSAAEAPAGMARLAESFRVLVVEDDDDVRESLALQMKVWGNEVESAATAAEALDKARAWNPQIVMCDLELPDGDGFQLCGALRGITAPGTLIAAVTGYARAEDQRRAAQAGFDSFLVKPLDAQSVVRLLRSVATRVDGEVAAASTT
jgi:PAS domain S-box-containing protein